MNIIAVNAKCCVVTHGSRTIDLPSGKGTNIRSGQSLRMKSAVEKTNSKITGKANYRSVSLLKHGIREVKLRIKIWRAAIASRRQHTNINAIGTGAIGNGCGHSEYIISALCDL